MGDTYYHTKESVEEYIEMAKEFDGRKLIEKLKDYLKQGSKVLELGSGPGKDWEILNEQFSAVGSDYSIEFLEHLKTKNKEGDFLTLNAVDIKTELHFDGIYTNKVLQHLTDSEIKSSVLRQHEILNEKGIICHSFWHGEGTETFNGMYVNYQSEIPLENLFGSCFEIKLLERYKEFDERDSILLIAEKI